MSEVREPFFTNLHIALEPLQAPENKKIISDNCWKKGVFEKFYDYEFQRRCVQLVGEDVGFEVADDLLDSLSEEANLTLETT